MNPDHFITYINSKDRLSTGSNNTSSDFTFSIDIPPGNYDSVCLLQASIPKSYYVIPRNFSTFNLLENSVAHGPSSTLVVIPYGNYSRKTLTSMLQILLTAASPNHYTYQVTYSTVPDTGKFAFVVNSLFPGDLNPSIVVPNTSTPSQQMGFNYGSTNTFVPIDGKPGYSYLESTNICNLQATEMIYVLSDMVSNNGSNVLQDINSSSPDFSMITFEVGLFGGIEANHKHLLHNQTNRFSLTLVNADSEVVDLNGLNWQCSIMFWDSSRYSANNFSFKEGR